MENGCLLVKKKMKAIGKTPIIKLERMCEPNCAEIYVKYEGGNPGQKVTELHCYYSWLSKISI